MHSGINEHKALMMAERGRKRNFNFKNFLALASIIVLISILPNIYVSYLVEPSGDAEINKIATNISMLNNSENDKIKSILDWEVITKNFSDTYGKSDMKTAAVRAFGDSPQIISYYTSGNCQELAFLFNDVANRAGMNSRVVATSTEDHVWDEVKIDNQWIPVDPTIYYTNVHSNMNVSWFNNTRAYEHDLHWFKLSRVYVIDTGEDVTNKYSDMGTLSIIFKPSDRIIIRTTKGDGVFNDTTLRDVSSYAINSKSSKLEIDLGEKNYTIIAEKDIIPFLVTYSDTQKIRVIKGETATIQLFPNKLKLIGLNVTW
jgi:hypothetical protein